MSVSKASRELERKIWKILSGEGCGMVSPDDLAKILKKEDVNCSWEEMIEALGRLKEKKGIFYGTFGAIWFNQEGV